MTKYLENWLLFGKFILVERRGKTKSKSVILKSYWINPGVGFGGFDSSYEDKKKWMNLRYILAVRMTGLIALHHPLRARGDDVSGIKGISYVFGLSKYGNRKTY